MNTLRFRLRLVRSIRCTRTSVPTPRHSRLLTDETWRRWSKHYRSPEEIARFKSLKKDRYKDTTRPLAKLKRKPVSTTQILPRIFRSIASYLKEGILEKIAPKLRGSGYKLGKQTFLCLIPAIPDIATLKRIEKVFDVPAPPIVKHEFFTKKSKILSVFELQQLYSNAKRDGLIIDWSVVDPLIRRICEDYNTVTSSDIEAAIKMYKTAKRAEESQKRQSARDKKLLSHYFNSAACCLAIRLATESENPKHIAFANSIIQALNSVKSKPSEPLVGACAAVAIRMATSCVEATVAYRAVRSEMKCKLSSNTYKRILWAYMRTVPSHLNRFVSVFHGYFTILKDLEEDGVEARSKHFIPLNGPLFDASVAIMNDQDTGRRMQMRRLLIDVLDRVRNRIDSEPPDIRHRVLLCQLMQVYGRLSHFTGVLEMWNSICETGLPDNPALSVFLDACGFGGEADLAIATIEELEENGYKLNGNNWLSFLECLCRAGRLDEAIRQFMLHSPRGPDGQPDRVAMFMILGQASRSRRLLPTRSLFKNHFPNTMSAREDDGPYESFLLTASSEKPSTKRDTKTL